MIQVKKEEQRLEKRFRDSYREYKRRTCEDYSVYLVISSGEVMHMPALSFFVPCCIM